MFDYCDFGTWTADIPNDDEQIGVKPEQILISPFVLLIGLLIMEGWGANKLIKSKHSSVFFKKESGEDRRG